MPTIKIITLLLFFTLTSCRNQEDNSGKQTGNNLILKISNKFDFVIKNGQIGYLKIGESLDEVIKKLNEFAVIKDSVAECEGCEKYTSVYLINDSNNQTLFELEPGWNSWDNDKLFRIRTNNKKFITDKGIKIGMTVKDLKKKYEILEVDTGGETGIHIIVKGFRGSFGIEIPNNENWWSLNKKTIPDSLRIEEIIIL